MMTSKTSMRRGHRASASPAPARWGCAFCVLLGTAPAQIGFPKDPEPRIPEPPGIMVIQDDPPARGVVYDSSKERKGKAFETWLGVIRRTRHHGSSTTIDHYHFESGGRKVRHGPYEIWRDGKLTLRGHYARGKKSSTWREFFSDGTVRHEYSYIDGKRWGASTIFTKVKGQDGKRHTVKEMVHHYRNGRRHGTYTSWWDNGEIHEQGQYTDGDKTGLWTSSHPNGRRWAEVPYVDDKRHGTKRIWSKQGELLKVEQWVAGRRVKR